MLVVKLFIGLLTFCSYECHFTLESWFDSQMVSPLPGGLDEQMRGIPTGGAQDQGYRSVPVVLYTTVLTQNITATVTATCVPGEWTTSQHVQFSPCDSSTLVHILFPGSNLTRS